MRDRNYILFLKKGFLTSQNCCIALQSSSSSSFASSFVFCHITAEIVVRRGIFFFHQAFPFPSSAYILSWCLTQASCKWFPGHMIPLGSTIYLPPPSLPPVSIHSRPGLQTEWRYGSLSVTCAASRCSRKIRAYPDEWLVLLPISEGGVWKLLVLIMKTALPYSPFAKRPFSGSSFPNLGALFEPKLHVTHIQTEGHPNISRKPAMMSLVLCLSIYLFFKVQDSLQDSLKIMKIPLSSSLRLHYPNAYWWILPNRNSKVLFMPAVLNQIYLKCIGLQLLFP